MDYDWGAASWETFLDNYGSALVFESLFRVEDLRPCLQLWPETSGMHFSYRKEHAVFTISSEPVKAGEFPREFVATFDTDQIRVPYLAESKSVDTTVLAAFLRDKIKAWEKYYL